MRIRTFHRLYVQEEDSIQGPFISFETRHLSRLDDVTSILNLLIFQLIPNVLEKIQRGEFVYHEKKGWIPFSLNQEAKDDPKALVAWKQISHKKVRHLEAFYVISMIHGLDYFYLPKQALYDLILYFQQKRAKVQAELAKTHPGPWLFSSTPLGPEPAPSEKEPLAYLERLIDSLDQDRINLEKNRRRAIQEGSSTDCTWEEKLKGNWTFWVDNLLQKLVNHGLIDFSYHLKLPNWWQRQLFDLKYRWVEEWDLPLIKSYMDAAMQLWEYLRSTRVPAPSDESEVLAAPISLEWFRHPSQPPEEMSAEDWLRFCDQEFQKIARTQTLEGPLGEILVSGKYSKFLIKWQREGDHPAMTGTRFLF